MSSTGSHPRMLFDTDENTAIGGVAWTPDSQRQLYVRTDAKGDTFWSRNIHGGPATPFEGLSEFPKNTRGDTALLPDGQLIFQVAEPSASFTPVADTCDFWTMRLDMQTGRLVEKPKRLANGTGGCISAANATSDGKRVAFLQTAGDHATLGSNCHACMDEMVRMLGFARRGTRIESAIQHAMISWRGHPPSS